MGITDAQSARNIRAHMERAGVTQAQLAEHLGLTQAAISRRLTGRVPWRVAELVAVAQKLGVPVADLALDMAA